MTRSLFFATALLCACKTGPEPAPAPTTSAASSPITSASAPALPAAPPGEPVLVAFASGSRTLHGYLYRPAGAGPFPAIVYNHGSEEVPGTFKGQALFFVPKGYVVFVPHRRGQGMSKDAGEYINRVANDEAKFVAALDAQEEDVGAAISYLGTQPFVDAKRVAVAGCSLGGIESLLAAQRETKIVAAVDFAGASMTWSRFPLLQERMKLAAREAKVPVFFIQAENDFNTTPSRTLDAEMRAANKSSRVHIFPPNGSTPMEGHHFCGGGPSPAWGPEVIEFLEANMKR